MAEQTRKREQPRKQSQLSSVQIMFATILAVGLLLAINFSARIAAGQPLQEAYNKVLQEIEQLRADQAALIAERDYVQSDVYVERWARDEGKMVREGEILIIPVPSGSVVAETPAPSESFPIQTTPPEPQTWELWWALFFDGEPPEF